MKKYVYYFIFILVLFLIYKLPVSARNFKTCTRTETNLHVSDYFNNENNLNDIMTTPCVLDSDKVYDYANLLTDEEEENLYNQIQSYIEKTNFDLAVVTINENVKASEVAYADDFYDYNGFGKGKTRDGSLLLIDNYLRKIYISTNGNAILLYDENRIDSIIDSGYSDLKSDKYYNCFKEMINSMENYFSVGYSNQNIKYEINEYGEPIRIYKLNYKLVGGISAIITLIISIIFYNLTRLKIKVGSTISYLKDKTITTKSDRLVNTVVTHTLRNTDSGSGHSSGGQSYHSSSSGGFHGGGGRSF